MRFSASRGSEQYQWTKFWIANSEERLESGEARLFNTADLACSRSGKRKTAFGERRRDFFILYGLHTCTPIDDRPGRPHQALRRGRGRRLSGGIRSQHVATSSECAFCVNIVGTVGRYWPTARHQLGQLSLPFGVHAAGCHVV